ncbi:hypothetical protein LTR40_001440 [Exophiala xenobiotica]|nr:hypothetical protein LTR40_001440 [Exophiala xenobiotica]
MDHISAPSSGGQPSSSRRPEFNFPPFYYLIRDIGHFEAQPLVNGYEGLMAQLGPEGRERLTTAVRQSFGPSVIHRDPVETLIRVLIILAAPAV